MKVSFFLLPAFYFGSSSGASSGGPFVAFDVPLSQGEGFELRCALAGSVCDVQGRFVSSSQGNPGGDCGTGACQWISNGPGSFISFGGPCLSPRNCWVYCDDDVDLMNNCTCTLGSNGTFAPNGTSCALLENPPTQAPTVAPENRISYAFDYGNLTQVARVQCPLSSGAVCKLYGAVAFGSNTNFRELDQTTGAFRTRTMKAVEEDTEAGIITPAQWQTQECRPNDGDEACVMACDPVCTCEYGSYDIDAIAWIKDGDCGLVQDKPATEAPTTSPTIPSSSNPTGLLAVALTVAVSMVGMLSAGL